MPPLIPPVTTATGTLSKVYRKEAMPRKARGVAKSFLKASTREEDQQAASTKVVPGNQASSSATRSKDPAGKGNTPAPNFVGEEQERRHGLQENGPAGRPTAEAGGIGRGGGTTQAGERIPRVERAKGAAGKARTAGSVIDEAIEDGARDFNDQVKHRSKMIRDGRKRSNDRHK